MSHITVIKLNVTNLVALGRACEELGLVLNLGQETYRWFGYSVGDYPIPQGFTVNDLGKCAHAITLPKPEGARVEPYEIGVVARRDGKPGYALMWDFWQGGHGMEAVVGHNCKNLVQLYGKHAGIMAAQANGYTVTGVNKLKSGKYEILGVKA